MTDNVHYLSAVRKIAERTLTVVELIQAAEALRAAGTPGLSIDLYKRWIAGDTANPLLFAVLFNYSVLLTAQNDLAGARAALERAVAIKPDFFPALINLGGIVEKLGAPDKAVNCWMTVINKLPELTGAAVGYKLTALKQIGRILESSQQNAAAETTLRQSLEIDPTQRQIIEHFVSLRLLQCEWPIISGSGVDRKMLLQRMGPLPMSIYTDDPLLQLASAWDYAKETTGYHPPCPAVRPRPANPGRLRIGYLSSDLRSHAVGSLMPEVFELHDRGKVEVFAYYCGRPAEDPIKVRIRNAIEHWVDISAMDDAAAASQIAADSIDILVDLNGNTREARTGVFALRPAPVIVNWLGYPGTMGSPYHHYIISDEWIIPKGSEIYYSEKVARLPCYQPNDRKRVIAQSPPSRADAKLPADAMVYCCFNGTQKISRFAFERWMTILGRVPGSVLWLLDGGEDTRKRLLERAAQRGISAERLIFAPKMAHPDHLARYVLADLFLDTSPYGAHTTASDALWMGVPILTLSGHGFSSRVCGSLARAAGLPEAVCKSPEEYVERAVALGKDRAELQRQKKQLASKRATCALFDMESLVRHLEALYLQMWEEYHQGRRPRPDLTNLDAYLEIGSETDHDSLEMLGIKDYAAWYRERLTNHHRRCALPEDPRLWTAAEIARVEAADGPPVAAAAHRAGPRPRKPVSKAKKRSSR